MEGKFLDISLGNDFFFFNLTPIAKATKAKKKVGIHQTKKATEEFIYRAAMEKQTQRADLWTWGEGRRR